MVSEDEKWVQFYSSNHQILLVGDGDFSFSSSLARSFGSASNIVATSLDTYVDVVVKKYKEAKSNLETLINLGASPIHGVNATMLKTYRKLRNRKFDRIVFNFPHAGFGAREDDSSAIHKHRRLVHGFFWSARSMLQPNGEIHVNHKTTPPFSLWNLEELASWNSLALIECVEFNIKNYPGYKNKRGDGARCDKPFHLGKCSTYKFRLFSTPIMPGTTSHFAPMCRRFEQSQIPSLSTSFDFNRSEMGAVAMFNQDFHQQLQRFPYPPYDHGRDYLGTFTRKLEYTGSIQGLNHHGMVSCVNDLKHKRKADHDIHIVVESNKRTCFDMGPFNEVGHTSNNITAMLPGRITNYGIDMHRYYECDQRTQMPLGRTFNNLHVFSDFNRRTCLDPSFPVNESILGFNRDMTTVFGGRTLNHGNHFLPGCEYSGVERRRLVRDFGN
ncbi:hypothetical protein F8388_022706 [Cannabis sativa]|uniref:25S rRNA (uridine-N(3))-methyltransferase BMT5-like domain-containing protein n=1 Tax=Cannabis sativa TaxID=3483 RepID=A0A7J6HST5_CANSA|nr:hypothetical protein F8388_022706 [Cannabis sativa]KAF4398346.1 hypothetical protein G4B88_025325 [Cannabis sativa]